MLIKTKAIVLRSIRYADNKIIVDLFTESSGRLSVAVKVSCSAKGRMRRVLFQPLTVLLIEMDYRQNSGLQRLGSAAVAVPWASLSVDPVKVSVALFLAEVLCHVLRQEFQDEALFRFLETSFGVLDLVGSRAAAANFHLAFLVRLTHHLGFCPSAEGYRRGCMFDMRLGEFVMLPPPHRETLSAAESAAMYNILRMTYGNMHLFRFSRQERRRCLEIVVTYYRIHLPSFQELRSLAVMQELFDE